MLCFPSDVVSSLTICLASMPGNQAPGPRGGLGTGSSGSLLVVVSNSLRSPAASNVSGHTELLSPPRRARRAVAKRKLVVGNIDGKDNFQSPTKHSRGSPL